MMFRKTRKVPIMLFAFVLAIALSAGPAFAQKPTVAAPCVQCHQAAPDVVRGSLVSVSEKFGTVQLAVGKLVWVVKYDQNTKLAGATALKDIPKDKEISVSFTGTEKEPYAVSVAVKPPAKLPPEKLLSTKEVADLIALGPEKGGYVLLDSRPLPRYIEGHLPTALPMPLSEFDKLKEKLLPADKAKLVVFYCAGVT